MNAAASLSIVIPTHNRAATLRTCLEALFRQRHLPADAEILVVDDGSVDDTAATVASLQATAPRPVVYLRQGARGPAAARNHGLREARGVVVLFLGDDIIAQPGLVEQHLAWHERFPDPATAVLGFVTWLPSLPVTPYMQWLEASGNQFDYGRLQGQVDIDPALYLYTSNLSLKPSFLRDSGEWFDERFRHAMLEDIDLGRRLAMRGLRLKYNPDAVAYHDHAVTLAGYVRRIQLSSEYWVLLEDKRKAGERADALLPTPDVRLAPRRRYGAYAWYLARVIGDMVRTWPAWMMARYLERRRSVPAVFERAHRYWAYRGLLRLEARRAAAKMAGGR